MNPDLLCKPCVVCGKELRLRPSETGRRFCSFECMGIARRKTKACAKCGNEFRQKTPKAKYCSRKCFAEDYGSNRVEITCARCGQARLFAKCFSDGRYEKKYCSRTCAAKSRPAKKKTGRVIQCAVCGKERYATKADIKAKFCSPACRHKSMELEGPGCRREDKNGYVYIYFPKHPDCQKGGSIMEHRLVAERKIGRRLLKAEHVHHINGIRNDNRPENLEILAARDHLLRTRKDDNALRAELARYREEFGLPS